MTMLLTLPLTAKGQWNGFPITSSVTDADFEWNIIRTNRDPIAQLWYASVERFQIYPTIFGTNAFSTNIIHHLSYTASYSNQTTNVVLGGVTNVFTNEIAVIANLYVTNNLWNMTNLFRGTNVVWTNQSDVILTNVATAFLSAQDYLAKPYYDLFNAEAEDSYFPSITRWLCTNEAVNGNYNAWFVKTNSSGAHPIKLPCNDQSVASDMVGGDWWWNDARHLFRHELGTNHIRLTDKTNEFGLEYSSNPRGTEAWFSRDWKPLPEFLGQTVNTNNGWRFISLTSLDRFDWWGTTNQANIPYWHWMVGHGQLGIQYAGYFLNTNYPVLIYETTGSVPVGVGLNVVLNGWIVNTNAINSLYATQAIETVAISGSNTVCTNQWVQVTNMTFSAVGATNGIFGDTISLRYTNGWAVYHTLVANPSTHMLDAQDLDERYRILNALRWSGADEFKWRTETYYWCGTSSVSWGDAVWNCVSNPAATESYTDLMPPCAATFGWWWNNAQVFAAAAVVTRGYIVIDAKMNNAHSRVTNYAHDVDFYVAFQAYKQTVYDNPEDNYGYFHLEPTVFPGGTYSWEAGGTTYDCVWDAQGTTYSTNPPYPQLSTNATATNLYTTACTSAVYWGMGTWGDSTSRPPNWCAAPVQAGDIRRSKGFFMYPWQACIRFDVTNGLTYK